MSTASEALVNDYQITITSIILDRSSANAHCYKIPDAWQRENGWKIPKDFIRDNIHGQPGNVKIRLETAICPVFDLEDAWKALGMFSPSFG